MVCRQRGPASEFARLGWTAERGVFLGAGDGRGAWLCSWECARNLSAAPLARAWHRVVSDAEVALGRDVIERCHRDRMKEV